MKELVKHIEILLLEHDCVVVPQIGGFVTCNAPAKYIEDENLFLPPIRTVGFNERLKADDGLLMRSYVSAYHCTEAEAKKMLGEQIRDLQQELWENGTYDLGSIGVLTLDAQGNVQFSPCQAGTVCPAYYGLDALFFEPLQELAAGSGQEAAETSAVEGTVTVDMVATPAAEQKRGEITIRVKTSWLQNVAAVAAVVLLFFLVTPDVKNTDMASACQAEFTRLMWMPAAQETVPEPIVKEGEKGMEVSVAASAEKKEAGTESKAAAQAAKGQESVESGYCVVVASAISERNARHYVERLHEAGYDEARVYKKGKMVRVVFPGYETESQAYAKMNALSDRSEEFASAWVYRIK